MPKIYDDGVVAAAWEMTGQEPRDVKIERYFPDVLARAREFMALAVAINPELTAVSSALWRQMLNTFVYRLDTLGARRWETMLSIYPPVGATLDERRYEILLKINNVLPYTYRSFQNMLDSTFGEGVVSLDLDAENYCLYLLLSTDFYEFYDRLKTFTRATVPANLGIFHIFSWRGFADLSSDINDDNFTLGLNIAFEENIDLGVIRYRKPILIGSVHNGAQRYNEAISHNAHYTADISYGAPAKPELFYAEIDAAQLRFDCALSPFEESYKPLLHDGCILRDGTSHYDTKADGRSYDGGLNLVIEHTDNSTETITF